MIQKLKAKANDKKGFTLAELLVVVAIIAILVAIAIPMFSAAQDKAQAAVYTANCRSAYAEAMVAYISGTDAEKAALDKSTITYDDGATYTVSISGKTLTVTCDKDNTITFSGSLDSKPTPSKNP